MNRRRAALVVLTSTALALGLSGCDKPNPGASVFSGTTSQFQRAACWAADGTALDQNSCSIQTLQAAAADSPVPVIPGQTVGISVDPVIADGGWNVWLGDKQVNAAPITSTYFRFTYPETDAVPADGALLNLVAANEDKPVGLWAFSIVRPS